MTHLAAFLVLLSVLWLLWVCHQFGALLHQSLQGKANILRSNKHQSSLKRATQLRAVVSPIIQITCSHMRLIFQIQLRAQVTSCGICTLDTWPNGITACMQQHWHLLQMFIHWVIGHHNIILTIPGFEWLLAALAVACAGLLPARLRRSSACACAAAAAHDIRDTKYRRIKNRSLRKNKQGHRKK